MFNIIGQLKKWFSPPKTVYDRCPTCNGPAEKYEFSYKLPERKLPAANFPEITVSEFRWRFVNPK